ncbi:hypothetical protein NOM01_14460 [Sporolactobacillus sp. STSJ-5]|uniref:hypothetical protein n=1 Tax=Sporolactobacillus sp. STSJ-5 TaxID=2965076 RepID=UPI002105DACE|nr:hypothetical protein [Sporolactobacillus sp. STSJ-5]MCQ2011188.1 hypothetical protein [Sporolactobacillus sp. STSJ-5]
MANFNEKSKKIEELREEKQQEKANSLNVEFSKTLGEENQENQENVKEQNNKEN